MICPHCQRDTDDVSEIANVGNVVANVAWFDAFWSLYPRKVAKASALKAWKKVCTGEAVKDAIMLGLSAQIPVFRNNLARDGRQYIPHAATWLNGGRWEDEAGARGQAPAARVITCELCGDSGLYRNLLYRRMERCSCARGKLPGLVVPQGEANDSTPF